MSSEVKRLLETAAEKLESANKAIIESRAETNHWKTIAAERNGQIGELEKHFRLLEEVVKTLLSKPATEAPPAPAIVIPRQRAQSPHSRRALAEALDKFDEQTVEARKKELKERLDANSQSA